MSPFHPELEVIGDLVIKLHVPYSDKKVTIKVNPNITEYKKKMSNNVRQYTETTDIAETKILSFDFQKNNVHTIMINGKNYKIRLLNMMPPVVMVGERLEWSRITVAGALNIPEVRVKSPLTVILAFPPWKVPPAWL